MYIFLGAQTLEKVYFKEANSAFLSTANDENISYINKSYGNKSDNDKDFYFEINCEPFSMDYLS